MRLANNCSQQEITICETMNHCVLDETRTITTIIIITIFITRVIIIVLLIALRFSVSTGRLNCYNY